MKTKHLVTLATIAALGICPLSQAATEMRPHTYAAQQASVQCAALSKLPANVEAWAAINVDNTYLLLPDEMLEEIDETIFSMIDSVAIGITPEAVQTINQAGKNIYSLIPAGIGYVLKDWSSIADKNVAPALTRYINAISDTQIEKTAERNLCKSLISTPIPGTYTVISFKPGSELFIHGLVNRAIKELKQQASGHYSIHHENGWKGLELTFPNPESLFYHYTPTPQEIRKLSERSCFVVTRIEGNNLIIATTEDPRKLQAVSAGATALVHTDKVAHMAAATHRNFLASCYIGKDLVNATQEILTKSLQQASKTLKGIFYTIAKEHPNKREESLRAIRGIDSIIAELSKPFAGKKHPLTATAWHDGDLHLEITQDAGGMEFTTAKVDSAIPQDTMLHAYGTTLTLNNAPSLDTMLEAASGIAEGVAITFPYHIEMSIKGWTSIVNKAPSIARILAEPALKMYNSLGNGWSVSINTKPNKWGSLIPIISGSITLNDRQALEDAWYETRCILVGLAAMNGERAAKEVAEVLTFDPYPMGNTIVYKSRKLISEGDYVHIAYALTDSKLCFTSHADQIGTTLATPGTDFAGVSVNFNTQPLVKAMRQELTIREQAYKQKQAQYQQEPSYYYNWEQYAYERAQHNVREWEIINKYVSGAKLNITTDGGKLRMKLDIFTPYLK